VSQAAVENADQSVGKGPEGLVVGGAAGSLSVVERACSGGVVERSEHLQEQRIRGCQMSPSRTRRAMSLWVPQ
jgi:hypothetical protein